MTNDRKANTCPGLGRTFSQKGFTLLELAFVLTIIGLIIGAGAELLPMLVKQSKLKDDRSMVDQAKNALIGYAMANGRLPYASDDTNGYPSPAKSTNGYLPWATLGINGKDAYQNTMFYAVESHLADPLLTSLTIKKKLQDLSNNTTVPDLFCNNGSPVPTPVAFVVISGGENRRADSPNDDTGEGRITMSDNNRFADPSASVTSTYDDICEVEYLLPLSTLFP
jgi:prepilin-type N-terminal cleavage/methylation domain-containing protein